MWKNPLLCLCLVICLSLGAVTSAQEGATTPSEEAAIQAFRQGSFSRAVELYRQALQETDDASHRARLHINIAWTLFALGREAEVQTHLRAALLEDPNLTLLPDYYTQEFIDLFDQARARGVESELEAPPPDLEMTIANIEVRIEQQEDLEGALADVDRLLAAYPRSPLVAEACLMKGLSHLVMGKGQTAALYLDKCLELLEADQLLLFGLSVPAYLAAIYVRGLRWRHLTNPFRT